MNYIVELTCIYNGTIEIDAENEREAIDKAQEMLNNENLAGFPDGVEMPNGGYFSFGEATADYAYTNEQV